jgi:putative ABC transport system substrate-binding protein
LMAKQFELLKELAPKAHSIIFLVNPTNPNVESKIRDVQEAADTLGHNLLVLKASTDSDLATAFNTIKEHSADALFVASDPFFDGRPEQFVAIAARYRVPAIFSRREFTAAGGLMSYGANFTDAYRQVGVYTGRILKGEKPADLPVIQSTKIELVVNLKTAETLGIEVPPLILGRADEVIE